MSKEEKSVKDIQLDNTLKFLEEYRTGKKLVHVEVDGHVKLGQEIKVGQIRQAGKGRFLVLREKPTGWLVCQVGEYEHPAAESEIRLSETLLMWNAFPSNGEAVMDAVLVGNLSDEELATANEFYDRYMEIRSIPDDMARNTGIGTVWDTEELVRYMEHMSAELGDFIVKALQ